MKIGEEGENAREKSSLETGAKTESGAASIPIRRACVCACAVAKKEAGEKESERRAERRASPKIERKERE